MLFDRWGNRLFNEPKPFSATWFSHKFKHAAVRYEVEVPLSGTISRSMARFEQARIQICGYFAKEWKLVRVTEKKCWQAKGMGNQNASRQGKCPSFSSKLLLVTEHTTRQSTGNWSDLKYWVNAFATLSMAWILFPCYCADLPDGSKGSWSFLVVPTELKFYAKHVTRALYRNSL